MSLGDEVRYTGGADLELAGGRDRGCWNKHDFELEQHGVGQSMRGVGEL